jgi:hypothetical protein
MEGGTWKEEDGGKVLKKAAGMSLKKLEPGYEEGGAFEKEREGKSCMDGVTLS